MADVHARREKKRPTEKKRELLQEKKKRDTTSQSEVRDEVKLSRTQYKARYSQVNLLMLQLWDIHVSLTREVILAAVINTPNKDSSVLALFDNQVKLGDNLALYYGKRAGNKYTSLLKIHIKIAIDIVVAVLSGTDPANLIKDWYNNADEIACFLSELNQCIKRKEIKALLDAHLECTLGEATLIIGNKFADSIGEYLTCMKRIKKMSEYISSAIVKEKFS